jgi:hypothetical protein
VAGQIALNPNKKMISISDLITKSWEFYRKNFKVIIPIIVLVFLGTSAEMLLRYFLKLPGYFSLLGILISIPFYAITIWLTVLTIEITARTLVDEKTNLKNLALIALKKLPMSILLGIIVGVIIIFGLILLIIPGIIFAIWFHFTLYTFILEGKKCLEALKESKILVQGRWWLVFWRLVVVNLFWGVVTTALVYGVTALITLPWGKVESGTMLFSIINVVLSLVSNLITALAGPLLIASSLLLYFNLRESRSLVVPVEKR